MKAWEVIGYTADADYLCVTCARKRYPDPDAATDSEGNEVHPIFASDAEFDYIPSCGACGAVIEPVTLTAEGMSYTRAALLGAWGGTAEDRDTWERVYRDNGGDLTRYGYGIGCVGCLYDSQGGPYDTEEEAQEALRELLADDNDQAHAACDGADRWTEIEPGFWSGPGTYYAEVYDSDEPGESWDEGAGPGNGDGTVFVPRVGFVHHDQGRLSL